MPFAPLVTVVTTVTVAVAATLAVTARRDLVVPYARRSPAFKSVVTNHRPPSSGATCAQGQRWLTPCRACLCTERGVLRCRSLPCSPTGRSPIVVDGLVIPPHLNMRASSAYTDHAFHSKKGESAERADQAAEPSVIDSSEPDSDSASDSDSESAADSQEDADALSEGDYSQDSEASSRSFTRKSMRSLTEFNRAPPVQQLPDRDLDVICNYWLQNQPKGRGDGDYSFDDGDPTLAANLRDLEHRSYQNPRRAPPVQQLPEPTVDEICQKWLETKLPRKPSSLSQKPTSLQTQRAANGDKSPMTSSPVHSPPRSHNNYDNNRPLLFLYRIHQTARSSRDMPPILTPDYNFPSFYPISYNPYPQLPTRPTYCPFYTKELPSAASTHRSPLGYSPLPLPLPPPVAPRPTPVVPLLPPPPPPPAPAPVPPPPARAVPCNANPPATKPRDVRGLKPEIHNVNDADHFKLHPNAISVPVRRRRSAVEEGRTAYSPKDHLRFPKFGSPVKYVSEYSRVQSISHNQASQPIQDLENSRIVLPMVRKK